MTSTAGTFQLPPADRLAVQADPGIELAAVLRSLDSLSASADPMVVFTEVARLCVPLVCQASTVLFSGAEPYSVSWPQFGADLAEATVTGRNRSRTVTLTKDAQLGDGGQLLAGPRLTKDAVVTPILPATIDGEPDYRGVLIMKYPDASPSAAQVVLGQLIVDRALAIVHRERLALRLAEETSRAQNLELAVASNREIGMALGIIMAMHKLTSDQAFDLLRRLSQHAHRKARDIAREIVHTGAIELPSTVTLIAPPPARTPADLRGRLARG
jgi:hypothetical protein